MVSFEADDNRFERTRMVAEARAAGDANRAPGGIGWTDMFVAPLAPVGLAERWITLTALRDVLGPACTPYGKVSTGSSSQREDVATGFAFDLGDGATIYGCTTTDLVTQLYITHCPLHAADLLHRLGTTFRLILCDLWRDEVVELASKSAVDAYLARVNAD